MTALGTERAIILDAIAATHGHRGHAAARLGWGLRTLHRRIVALDLAPALARMARRHGWPDGAAAARAARSAAATARRLAKANG